jgi:hypothetical protein
MEIRVDNLDIMIYIAGNLCILIFVVIVYGHYIVTYVCMTLSFITVVHYRFLQSVLHEYISCGCERAMILIFFW